jgi:hypothetical protein
MRPSQLHVLPFVLLLLVTFKSTLGFENCTLCWDGATITKPGATITKLDYSIGLANNTCKDLSDSLLFLDSDSYDCEQTRFLYSADCGCPVSRVSLDPCTTLC